MKETCLIFKLDLSYRVEDISGTQLALNTGSNTWTYADANFGVGVSYLMAHQIKFIAGYDYKAQVLGDH